MGQRSDKLAKRHIEFIKAQKLFFVGTATADSRINVSPKGMDSLRVVNPNRVIWLNVTGSGNETAAHVQELPRMTLMFCAFEGQPMILRVYGTARAIHTGDPEWDQLAPLLPALPGARQIFDLTIELVQTSCGMGVPLYSYEGDRNSLNEWADRKGDAGVRDYWEQKNQSSLDGVPTQIMKKSAQPPPNGSE